MRPAGYFIVVTAAIVAAITIPLLVPAFRPDGITTAAVVNNMIIALLAVGAVVGITIIYPLETPEKPGVPDTASSDDDLDIPAFLRGLSSNRFSRDDDRSPTSFEVRGNDTMHRRPTNEPDHDARLIRAKLSRRGRADFAMHPADRALGTAEFQPRR